jgi:hypothetical protein
MFMISENEVCSVVSTDEKHVGKNSVEIWNPVHFPSKQTVDFFFHTGNAAIFNF